METDLEFVYDVGIGWNEIDVALVDPLWHREQVDGNTFLRIYDPELDRLSHGILKTAFEILIEADTNKILGDFCLNVAFVTKESWEHMKSKPDRDYYHYGSPYYGRDVMTRKEFENL